MQAIRTTQKYGIFTAECAAGKCNVRHAPGVSTEDMHKRAARVLAYRLAWDTPEYGDIITGCLPDGSYCHVFTNGK